MRKVYHLMESSHTDIAVTEVKILLLQHYFNHINIYILFVIVVVVIWSFEL